jgi:hypothetical protein
MNEPKPPVIGQQDMQDIFRTLGEQMVLLSLLRRESAALTIERDTLRARVSELEQQLAVKAGEKDAPDGRTANAVISH